MISVNAHTSIIGDTGYNCHSRNFFKALNQLAPVSVRNWTIGKSWKGYHNDEPHNDEYYMDDELRTMLSEQTLGTPTGHSEFPLYTKYKDPRVGRPINIVLNDNRHPYFNETYVGPKIAYNVWETTRQPDEFFDRLRAFDQVWVPSKWQRTCTIEQGIPADRVKVVPEGVDGTMFHPVDFDSKKPIDRPFRFVLVGRWEYRKSTREIIQAFIDTFSEDESVELILNVDNQFANDGLSSTEERLDKFKLTRSNIKVVHHLSKIDYLELLRTADVFVSCARSEGWNLPLIEAMACGVPALYSDWGAQLEFSAGRGIPVKIVGEVPAGVENSESWDPTTPGNFAEPDFSDLREKLRLVYSDFETHKKKALLDSGKIRNEFTWENAANIAYRHLSELDSDFTIEPIDDFAWVTCGNLGYMPIIEGLVKSLAEFSDRKILVYGIGCDAPFDYPNVIYRKLEIPHHSIHDKWYWKQYACIESLKEGFSNLVWLDGDIVVNHNIDTISKHFNRITEYPIPDKHVQDEFVGYYSDELGNRRDQLFNEELCKKYNVKKLVEKAHICMYIYNDKCKWWFEEILKIYKETPLNEYSKLLQWNDEGIDNFLRSKYQYQEMLPISNFDVSEWDGDLLGTNGQAIEHFITFWRDKGPINFGKIFGWQFVPEDKSSILYFHGNKNLKFAELMLDFIKTQRDQNFHETEYFFTSKNEIKNLGEIKGVHGGTLEIADKYGWDYAIYHEIYNLKDYEFEDKVKVRPGDVVVDLGGNIGVFTRYAHHMGAEKIVTFEPDRRYFEILKQNSPASAVLFNAAIGNKLGNLVLTESPHLGGSNLWHETDPLVTQYEVGVYTLDYLLETRLIDRIDFLKVDIEGSELISMQGISDDNLSRVRNIAVEYHHEHLKFNDSLRHDFVARLNRLGFNSYMVMCGHDDALQLIYFWK